MKQYSTRCQMEGENNQRTSDDFDKCQTIFYNLAYIAAVGGMPKVFLREFWQTTRCDDYHNFSSLRKDYVSHMGRTTLDRIMTYKEDYTDAEKATQTVVHYADWTKSELLKALTFPKWIKFKIHYVLDGAVGAGTFLTNSVKWASKAVKHSQHISLVKQS